MGLRLMYFGYFLYCQPRRGDTFVTDNIARQEAPAGRHLGSVALVTKKNPNKILWTQEQTTTLDFSG